MTDVDVQKQLDELRAQIDEKDAELVRVIEDRAKIVMRIRDLKAAHHVAVYDPRREEEIFQKITSASDGTMYSDALRDIYDCILRHMKEL
jgi:chorismate mutase